MTGPLVGRVVLVTRAADQADALATPLREEGASVLAAPAIEILPAPPGPLDDALRRAASGAFAWIVLTSAAGVSAVGSRLTAAGATWAALRARIAAVGDGTAAALRAEGVGVDLIPPTFTTEALGHAMPEGDGRVLLARADIALPGLEVSLGSKGWTVERVDAYHTRLARGLPSETVAALREGNVDAITFTSASTVDGFARAAGAELLAELAGAPRRPRVVCIGPVTAEAARAQGLEVDSVAEPHTIEGLVAAVTRTLAERTEEHA